MDDIPVKRNCVFFNNLILLGLDPSGLEKKHGIAFHKDMFVLPNKKGFEVITHFLFYKLSAITNKDYNIPWPLISKEQGRVFQKTCFSHLSSFAQESVVMFPHMVPSVLSTFGGDRFYEVYLAFSSYVLSKTMQSKGYHFLSRPVVTKENFLMTKEVLQLSTVLSMQRFRDAERVSYVNHTILSKFAKKLSETLEKLKSMLKINKDLVEEKLNMLGPLFSVDPNDSRKYDKVIEKICDCYKPLKEISKKLDYFLTFEAKHWQYLATDIGDQNESHLLDGHLYNICITDEMPKSYQSEIQKTGFSTSEENGELSVLRLMKLLQAYLKYVFDVLLNADLNQLHKTCSIENPSLHEDIRNYIRNLLERLTNEVSELEQSIKNLKQISGFSELNNMSAFQSLPALSFDPEAVRGRMPNFKPGELLPLPCMFGGSVKSDVISTGSLSVSEKGCAEKFRTEEAFIEPGSHKSDHALEGVSSNAECYTEMTPYTESLLMGMKKENPFLTNLDSRKSQVPIDKTSLLSQHMSISDFDDLTSGPAYGFCMSESLLLEQSFNSVALPDMSLDE